MGILASCARPWQYPGVKILVVLMSLLLGGAAIGWFGVVAPELASLSVPGNRAAEDVLLVPAGANTKQVAQLMQRHGMLHDARLFYWFARYKKFGAPKSGEYAIAPTASPLEVFDKLVRGEVITYEISFPEGLHYKEIAKRIDGSPLLSGEALLRLCEDRTFLTANKIDAENCEGYLFPDTYRFAKGRQPSEIVAAMIKRHHDLFDREIEPKRASTGLTKHQLVTLASIVEKETGAEEERPRIARVFLNRLKLHIPLATDPTVIYAVLKQKGSFDGNLKREHLVADIPYNTYKRAGLPPGPISNPGLKALHAVIEPTTGDDLFFVSRNDGHHIFCPTLACHEENVRKWQVEFFRKKRAAGKTAKKTK